MVSEMFVDLVIDKSIRIHIKSTVIHKCRYVLFFFSGNVSSRRRRPRRCLPKK